MKKFYTEETNVAEKNVDNAVNPPVPRASTLAFLKQFARCYCGTVRDGMPGIVLN